MATSSIHFQHSFFFLLISELIIILSLTFLIHFTFSSLLLSTLISLFLYPFIFLYFLLFLFPSSCYKFTILFSILFIVFLHKKKKVISHSHFFFFSFLVDFLKIIFLHLYFTLMNFCIIRNSTLG